MGRRRAGPNGPPEVIQLALSTEVDCIGEGCAAYADELGSTFPCGLVQETTNVWAGSPD